MMMNEIDRFKFDWHMDDKTLDKSLEISHWKKW